ncbi:hypothetical protein Ahy_A05g025357 isoform C [Arachis hypogaea]|uniref:WAT1-related protein n=1 Tax=Arachis hypogaea TaxID=3818 RepID=A0A445D865_ARAHY|nr:hypothetical protein Ahy_A05g025357 isoform C [Arachis hypogaea]
MGNKIIAPFVGMVMAMVLQSGSMVVIKAAMNDDFNKYVLIVYSLALSTLLLLPFLFLLPRSERPTLSFSTLCNLFLLSLCGSSGQIFAYVGIDLSSPTLASAMLNLIPALTFPNEDFFSAQKFEDYFNSTRMDMHETMNLRREKILILLELQMQFTIILQECNAPQVFRNRHKSSNAVSLDCSSFKNRYTL